MTHLTTLYIRTSNCMLYTATSSVNELLGWILRASGRHAAGCGDALERKVDVLHALMRR